MVPKNGSIQDSQLKEMWQSLRKRSLARDSSKTHQIKRGQLWRVFLIKNSSTSSSRIVVNRRQVASIIRLWARSCGRRLILFRCRCKTRTLSPHSTIRVHWLCLSSRRTGRRHQIQSSTTNFCSYRSISTQRINSRSRPWAMIHYPPLWCRKCKLKKKARMSTIGQRVESISLEGRVMPNLNFRKITRIVAK